MTAYRQPLLVALVAAAGSACSAGSGSEAGALFPYVTGVQYKELLISKGLEQGILSGGEVSVAGFGGGGADPENRVDGVPGSDCGGPELRCQVEDTGRLAVSAEWLGQVAGAEVVAVERTRWLGFRAAGLQRGELEVVVRHVVTEASQ